MADEDTPVHRNEVVILGRVSAAPAQRVLPSGDEIASWRVVVERTGTHTGVAGQDALECTAWTARVRRSVAGWDIGDIVEIEGSVRRRFWRTPGGTPASSYGIDVARARRVARVTRRRKTG